MKQVDKEWGFRKILAMCIVCTVLLIASSAQAIDCKKSVYYRQLVYNHVSPYMPLRGIHEISAVLAQKSPHYIFNYDSADLLVEIINNNPEKWKSHPLTHLKVHRVLIEYNGNKEIRTFFDKLDNPVINIRGVYKEVYTYNSDGFKTAVEFYDMNNQPMNSNWNAARYTWEKKNDLIIERRYNSNGQPENLSTYFKFGIIGILLDNQGFSRATYNLNEKLEVANNPLGVASYQDTYDDVGNHIGYAYYDQDNVLTNQPIFAIGIKSYDKNGNVIKEELLDANYRQKRVMLFNYDTEGSLIDK